MMLEGNDDVAAIKLASNPICTSRTKHIDVRYHFVKGRVDEKVIEASHIPTARQSADGLTNKLPGETLMKHTDEVFKGFP